MKHGHEHRKQPGNRLLFVEHDMTDQSPPTADEMFYLGSYAMTTVIENELYNWSSHKGKKRMELVGARLKSDVTNADLVLLKKHLSNPVDVIDARRLKDSPYLGWIRPLAVRCISGHSNGAVELTTIAISERVKQAIGGAWHMTSRHVLDWIASSGLLPGGPRHWRLDVHFSPFPPRDNRYTSNFTNQFAKKGEKGVAIYVPISALIDLGARLATKGVIFCRNKVPFSAIHAIFALSGTRGMGERLQSPSLVDEYVCDSIDGEDCVRASPKFVAKVADHFRADLSIPFTHQNNVATILRRVADMYPNETQTKDLINNITRAIVYNPREYECNCRYCPWCLHLTPATLVRCVRCNAALISVGRFMDQGSQGSPRALDSEILIEVDDESTIEGTIDEAVDIAQSSVVQDEIVDELQLVEESAAGIDLDAPHEEQELAKDT